MIYLGLALLLLLGALVYWFVIKNEERQNTRGIVSDRTEDKGFYEELDPGTLVDYQLALNDIFTLLAIETFHGNKIPRHHSEAIEKLLCHAAAKSTVERKYLRVMLQQFLQTDPRVRQQAGVADQWATRVYERDSWGENRGMRGIPSAWKIYFYMKVTQE